MADHDATLRLNLAAAGMLTMLQQLEKNAGELAKEIEGVGDESKKSEKKIHPMLESAKKGLGAAKSAAVELGGQLKSAVGMALTLGGALSLAGSVGTATSLVSRYKDIAFNIRTSTGAAFDWQQAQDHVEKTADKWSRTNEEVANSFDHIFEKTKNLDFAKKASEEAAKAAAATGKPMEVMSKLAADLGDKFNISADQISDAMASVISTGRAQELAENMHEIGAAARGMGLDGKEGLDKYISMLELAKGSMKDVPTAVASLRGLTEPLENLEARKGIEQKLKVKLHTEDGQLRKDALDEILKATGGQREELAQVFSGDTLNLVSEFGKTYQKGFDALEGSFKQKSEAGIVAFNKALLESLPDSDKAKKAIEDEANKRQDDPQEQLRKAVQKVTNAFAQPKMIESINKLADKLPALADIIARLVDFGAENPILTGAGLLAMKPGLAFGQSVASDAMSAGGKWALDKAKGTAAGKLIAETFASAASGSGKWAQAGKLFGYAGGAVAAGLVAKAIIDAALEASVEEQNKDVQTGFEARKALLSGDTDAMKKSEEKLYSRITQLQEEQSGAGANFMRGMGRLVEGDDFKSAGDTQLSELKAELAKLREAMAKSAEKGAEKLERAGGSLESAARHLKASQPKGGSGNVGTNGLPEMPG